MSEIIAMALVPCFFVLLLGYTSGRAGLIDDIKPLNAVTMNYAIPASLFVASISTSSQVMIHQWSTVVIVLPIMLISQIIWFIYQSKIRKLSVSESSIQATTVGISNCAAIGIPIVMALSGPSELVTVSIAIALGAIFPSTVNVILIEVESSISKGNISRQCIMAINNAIKKPVVIAPILGIILSLLGVHLPDVICGALKQIGNTAGGMALFVTGLILSTRKCNITLNVVIAVIVLNIIQPILAILIGKYLPYPIDMMRTAILMAALPAGFFGVLFGERYGKISQDANSILITSTLFSIITLPFLILYLY